MKPRAFLNFFKTRSGKLLLFVAVFGAGLLAFSALRSNYRVSVGLASHTVGSRLSQSATAQGVQTVERPMTPFHPPPPKPEPPPLLISREVPAVTVQAPRPAPKPTPLPPISLFADNTAGKPQPKKIGSVYAPFGWLIPCKTVITVDSSSMQTPIIGLVTENIYHAGRLVIPAGTEVHGTAQADRHRDRISTGTSWTLVWQAGEELRLKAIALDREFSGHRHGWGITDGSAGLRGELLKSDNLAEIKLFAATFLSGAAGALTQTQPTIFGPMVSPTLNNAPFQGAQAVLQTYAKRIYDSIRRDGFFVRVPSGKQFYLYVLQTIDRADAVIGGSAKPFAQTQNPNPSDFSDAVPLANAPPPLPAPASAPTVPLSKP